MLEKLTSPELRLAKLPPSKNVGLGLAARDSSEGSVAGILRGVRGAVAASGCPSTRPWMLPWLADAGTVLAATTYSLEAAGPPDTEYKPAP